MTRPPSADCRGQYPALAVAVAAWFAQHARPLPWRRTAPRGSGVARDPYRVLVSEIMLQQTQVSRVVDRFESFVARFPDLTSLADADESEVLALWSGLGYYRRARLLHRAARAVVRDFGGALPADARDLLRIPGIGRYTAGAIASLAFHRPEAVVDGNVARVLFRIHGRDAEHNKPSDLRWAWDRARAFVDAASLAGVRAGDLNEGLMELGATVCTPSKPDCECCPLGAVCAARVQARQECIPSPKRRPRRKAVSCDSVVVTDRQGRVLVEQRPATGMWASMWQAPTLERAGSCGAGRVEIARWLGLDDPACLRRIDRFVHVTTHRLLGFTLWRADLDGVQRRRAARGRAWHAPALLGELGMSNPQRRMISAALRDEAGGRASPPARRARAV